MKICIDPGHNASGADTGAEGYGLREQDLTLDIARRLRPLLEHNDFEVVMTRDGDFVYGPHGTVNESLQTRCMIANAAQANLFVSIHVNAGGGTGAEIHVLGPGGQAEKAASKILPYLVIAGRWPNRGIKVSNFYVLRNTARYMPAILTENGFIDNASDAAKLADPAFRQAIAVAHAKGICDYFGITYREDDTLDKAILLYSDEDYWAGKDVAQKLNCAIFVRPSDKSVPPEARKAAQLIVIGGPTTGHPNEVLLSGATKYDTAAKVGQYLKGV